MPETDDDLQGLDLAIQEQPERLLPLLGQLVDLRDPADVAHALDDVRGAKRQLDEVRALLEQVLRLECQRQGTKTLHFGDVDAIVSGGSRSDYDIERLVAELRAAGLPEDRLAQLVVETVSWKVDQRVARQLAAANPAYRDAIDRCRTTTPAPWRVSVETAKRG